MAEESPSDELKRLVEEFTVALELGQHGQVSSLSSKICVHFVDLFDELAHDEQASEQGFEFSQETSTLYNVVNTLCQKLREFGQLAAAYNNVISFVLIKDLASLSDLVNASPANKDRRSSAAAGVDFDHLTRILRQSVFLLKAINSSSATNRSTAPSTWLNRNSLVRRAGIGFPVFSLDLDEAFSEQPNDNIMIMNTDQLQQYFDTNLPATNLENHSIGPLVGALKSNWLQLFFAKVLAKPYPFDRFTILIAIWIVAVECRHWLLEQLIGELVDQIVHEETNSCNEEELMQLTQVGSFWLSRHKRNQTSIKQTDLLAQQAAAAESEESEEDEEEDDDEEEGEEGRFSANGELGSLSSEEGGHENRHSNHNHHHQQQQHNSTISQRPSTKEDAESNNDSMRLKMRRVIDDELLYGVQCLVCNYKPSALLEPLNAGLSSSCRNCKLAPLERCWISFRPLELTNLEAVLNRGQAATGPAAAAARGANRLSRSLVLVSPNEWARQMLLASAVASSSASWLPTNFKSKSNLSQGSQNNRLDEDSSATTIGERVDISENFERLTVIRRPRVGARIKAAAAVATEAEESDDESTTTARSTSSDNDDDDDSEAGQSSRRANYSSLLERFMRSRLAIVESQQTRGSRRVAQSSHQHTSESLRMIKFVALNRIQQQQAENTNASNIELPLYSADLIQLDSTRIFTDSKSNSPSSQIQFMKICLATSKELYSQGSIWACSIRSQVSQLMLGCGRLFSSLELIRITGKYEPLNEFVCPFCDNQLIEITNLVL